jgi:glycine/D-amino acid oxidase-like deaminating enzyme
MSEVEHVVVIGGGVAGCATAYELSTAGLRVTIVEREGVGTQASGWSAGGLNPLQGIAAPITALAMESFRLHQALWPALERVTGQPLGARRISMAYVAPDDATISELLELRDVFEDARGDGFSAQWLEAAEFLTLEPRISPRIAGALLTYGNGVLDSHRLTVLLAEAAQHHGATVRAGAVTGIQQSDSRVTGVELDDEVIPCDAVVVAMGPWAGAAEEWLGVPLPIEPLKGEILRMAPSGPAFKCDVVAPGISLFGREEGQVWLASTRQHVGFDKEPSEWAYRTLYDAAVALMPSIAEASLLQQTVCLRPVSPDELPIVGKVPGRDGVYVATGGGPKGILLAPAMGRALADLITTGQTALPIGPCDPARFARVAG